MSQQADLVIQGNLVLPDRIEYDGKVLVKDGKIVGIVGAEQEVAGNRWIDATGKWVLPGAIDAHVHCYSALEEGFTNASRSAAAGGVTTIIEMPYDATGMICTESLFLEKKERLEQEAVVDIAMLATIHKQGHLEEIERLAQAGACGFKVSMFNTDSFRFPRIDEGQLLEAFAVIAGTGRPVGVHAENDDIVRRYIEAFKEDGADARSHCWSRPKAAESTAAVTAMELAANTGVKLHLYHSTFPRVFQLAEFYRSQGVSVTAETCTHYLLLNEEDMPRLGARGKINPPLRSREDSEQLWALIGKGSIDMITSDHAPWTLARKSDPDIFKNASGAPGVENLLPLIYSEGVAKGRMTILQMVKLLSENPASVFGLSHRKGSIAPGMDADLVVLDPAARSILDERDLHSSAGWSPYNGMAVNGSITHTLVRGHVVYQGSVVGEPGDGTFIAASHARIE